MKKVVVTGGAGFIGSHLSDKLAESDYQVIILDDLSTGKMENIELLIKRDNVKFVKGSITDLTMLKEVLHGVQYVFHLAAIASVPRSISDPQLSHEVNTSGTLRVLLAAKDSGVSKVIYSSSSAVYGDTPTLPQREDMPPSPQSPYAVSKLTGEYYCRVFQQVYSLPAVCLRYFNVYGPRQDPDSQYAAVIPKFIKMISQGRPPVIYGDGSQTRDFIFVKDAVAANILAAESESTGVFNIGAGNSISISELALLITRLMGSNLTLVHKPARPGDIMHSLADISQAEAFGFRPKYILAKGLEETIKETK